MSKLSRKLIDGISQNIPDVIINSAPNSHIVNISFLGVDGKQLAQELSNNSIYVSTGSACSSSSSEVSHVLTAIGLTDNEARSTIRFSIGRYNTETEVNYFLDVLPWIVKRLRD